jgi:hypothetical protein
MVDCAAAQSARQAGQHHAAAAAGAPMCPQAIATNGPICAQLVVDGILRLPSRYRRGMFMDIIT